MNPRFVLLAVALAAISIAACGDGAIEPAPAPNRAPLASGSIPAVTVAVGDTAAVNVASYFTDPDGDALTFAATSSDPATATVAVTGSVLTVAAITRGEGTITVTARDSGGLSAQATFAVTVPNQAPVVRDSIQSGTLGTDETESWSGPDLFDDPDGDGLTYAASSSNPQLVRPWVTDSVLQIQGVSPGTSTVTFSAFDPEGSSARIVFDVTVLGPVVITGTVPSVLLEGAAATVLGSGFSPIASENRVFVGGLAARVTAVTETALSIEVPLADCLPPRQTELRVNVRQRVHARTLGVTPKRPEDLALQQGWYRYTRAGDGCLHLPGNTSGGEYVIGVVSVSEDAASLTGVTLDGTPGEIGVAGVDGARVVVAADLETEGRTRAMTAPAGRFPATASRQVPDGSTGSRVLAKDTLDMRRTHAHSDIMARNEALVRRLGRARRPGSADARRELQAGDTLTLYADFGATCSEAGQVRAVVRLVGSHFVWLEDRDNPGETFTDAELMCGTSNVAEITYLQVPDPDGSYGQAVSKEYLLDYYPALLSHEVTHIIQLGSGVLGDAALKTAWELEGGATLAEQLVAYRLFGHGSGREMGYAEYLAGADWYGAWLAELALFFGWDPRGDGSRRIPGAPEECSWVGRPEEGNSGPCQFYGREVYGVPSTVLRYALDRWGGDYVGGERAMMQRLTQSSAQGFASLVDVSPDRSWRPEQILSDFYITLWLDLQGWQTYGMSTWNLQDIFARVPLNAHLKPHVSLSTVPRIDGRRVRAGSVLYLHWLPTGALSPTSIKVTAGDGGPTPDHIAVWALRVR